MNYLCIKRGILRPWVNCWLRFRITEQSKFLVGCRRMLRSWTKEQLGSDPRSRSSLCYSESQNHASPRLWIAARYTEYYGYLKKRFFLYDHLLKKAYPLQSSTVQRIWHLLLSGIESWHYRSNKEKREWNDKRESLNTSVLSLHFQSRSDMLNHTGGTYAHKIMMRLSENSCFEIKSWEISWLYEISKLENQLQDWGLSQNRRSSDHNVLDQREFRLRNQLTNLWHRDRLWSEPISPDFDMLDAMITSALKSFSTRTFTSETKSKCRSAACSEIWLILERRTNYAHVLWTFPRYRSLWSNTRTLRLVHLEFTEWRRPRFRRSMGSCTIISDWNASDMIPEGLYSSKELQDSVQLQAVLTLYWSRNCSKQRKVELFTIEDSCKTSYWSDDENSFRDRNDIVRKRISKKERMTFVERKVRECFQWMIHGQCSKGDSCLFSHDTTASDYSDEEQRRKGRSDRLLLRTIRGESRLTERDKNPQREQSIKSKALQTKSVKFYSNSVKKTHVMWILSSSRVSELQVWKKDVYMTTNVMSDMLRQEGSPTRSQRKVVQKDQLRYWRSLCNWIACLKILIRESLFWCEQGKFGIKNTSANSPRTRDTKKKSGNKGSIARNYPKVCVSWT